MRKKRLLLWLLALVLAAGMGFQASASETEPMGTEPVETGPTEPPALTVTANGAYALDEAVGSVIISEGVTEVTLTGENPWTGAINYTGAPGLRLTLTGTFVLNGSLEAETVLFSDCTASIEGVVSGTAIISGSSVRAEFAEDAALCSPDGEPLYLFTAEPETAEIYTVTVDEKIVYTGPGNDGGLYLYLTGEDHQITINDAQFPCFWEEVWERFSPEPHAAASFAVTPLDAKIVLSEGNGYTYTEPTVEGRAVDAITRYSLTPGVYTATITKDGFYASQFSFKVTEEFKVTAVDTTSNVKNYLDADGLFTISLGTFTRSPNPGAWDGVTLDVSWYDENAAELKISTPAQLAGMAAICNGIYNAEITAILDDADGDGTVETYTPESYAALETRKIRPVCVGEDAERINANNQVTTSSYWYGARSSGTFTHNGNELPLPADFNGQTVCITADLDMGGFLSGGGWTGARYMTIGGQSLMHYIDYSVWESDGYSHIGSSFNGHLEGQGHIIRNIYCDRNAGGSNWGDSSSVGLIGRLGNHDNDPAAIMAVDPSVRDLAVSGYVFGRRSIGGIVGKIGQTSAKALRDGSTGGIIENCLNFCEVRNTDAKGVGGICGAAWNKGLIRNCANFGNIYAAYKNAGGISGSCEVKVENCYNVGYVDAVSIGYAQALGTDNGGAVFTNCYWLTGSSFADSDDGYSHPAVYRAQSSDSITEITSFAALAGEKFLTELNGDGRDWVASSGSDAIDGLLAAVSFENCKLDTSGVTGAGFPVPRVFVDTSASVTMIEKLSDPEKLAYVAGERFDTTGLVIRATYSDGTAELLDDYTVSPGILQTGDTAATVSGERGGVAYSFDFAITVAARDVVSIVIQTPPANVIYALEEPIDLSGLEVAAYFTDAPKMAVSLTGEEYTTSLNGDVLTVSYTLGDKTVTAELVFTRLASPAPIMNDQGYYELNCADHLTWFANQVTNVKNTAIHGRVTADIVADERFMGIGRPGAYFAGTFDGGGHTITLNMQTDSTAGLFTGVSGGIICNTTVAGSVSSTSETAGIAGLAAYSGTGGVTVIDCVNEADIIGGGYVGGILGKTANGTVSILGCENRGSITATADHTGGICGYAMNSVTIMNCVNSGSVSGAGAVGGILGYGGGTDEDAHIWLENCGNDGPVTGTTAVGGILGYSEVEYDTIHACYNAGSVTATALAGNSGVGGIVGFFAGRMESCYSCGDAACTANAVSGTQNAGVGGLVGAAYGCKIENCYHSGTLAGDGSGQVKLGGIAGFVYYGTSDASNAFWLDAEGLPAFGGSINSGANLTGAHRLVSGDELKNLTETLGADFRSNGDESHHGGYPVLAWEVEPHEHEWDAGEVTLDAACTESGVKTYTCPCGETRTEPIEALGHEWDDGQITRNPTCTESGGRLHTCLRCGETKLVVLSARGHAYESVTTEPSCTGGGCTVHTCANCGDSYTDGETEALGHAWDEGVTTQEAACTQAGEMTYTCIREGCAETRTETVPKTGHRFEDGVCESCGEVEEPVEAPAPEEGSQSGMYLMFLLLTAAVAILMKLFKFFE